MTNTLVPDEFRDKVVKFEEIIKLYKDQVVICSQCISLYELQVEVLRELLASQEPLGYEFEEILHKNLWDLYEIK